MIGVKIFLITTLIYLQWEYLCAKVKGVCELDSHEMIDERLEWRIYGSIPSVAPYISPFWVHSKLPECTVFMYSGIFVDFTCFRTNYITSNYCNRIDFTRNESITVKFSDSKSSECKRLNEIQTDSLPLRDYLIIYGCENVPASNAHYAGVWDVQ